MKTAGYICIILQILSLIGGALMGEDFSGHIFTYYIGRFIFGIAGVILLIKAYGKKNPDSSEEEGDKPTVTKH